jgi:hypothetical protein
MDAIDNGLLTRVRVEGPPPPTSPSPQDWLPLGAKKQKEKRQETLRRMEDASIGSEEPSRRQASLPICGILSRLLMCIVSINRTLIYRTIAYYSHTHARMLNSTMYIYYYSLI